MHSYSREDSSNKEKYLAMNVKSCEGHRHLTSYKEVGTKYLPQRNIKLKMNLHYIMDIKLTDLALILRISHINTNKTHHFQRTVTRVLALV